MLCYVMLCYVMLSYVMLSYVMLCYAMLCFSVNIQFLALVFIFRTPLWVFSFISILYQKYQNAVYHTIYIIDSVPNI